MMKGLVCSNLSPIEYGKDIDWQVVLPVVDPGFIGMGHYLQAQSVCTCVYKISDHAHQNVEPWAQLSLSEIE